MTYLLTITAMLHAPPAPTPAPAPVLGRHSIGVVTAYCSRCSPLPDANGRPLRVGIVAADTRRYHGTPRPGALHTGRDKRGRSWWAYWQVGDRIAFGPPISATLVVMDTGGAIRGKDRFDLCNGTVHRCLCNKWGVRRVEYRAVIAP